MKCPDPISARNHFRSLNFAELQRRLIRFVTLRIKNGEFTERGLARVLGISQPQLHNVLKGVRPLTPHFADVLLRQFEIGVLDLTERRELEDCLACDEIEFRESSQDATSNPQKRKPLARAGDRNSKYDRLAG